MLAYLMSKTSISYSIEMGTSMNIIPDFKFSTTTQKILELLDQISNILQKPQEKNVKLKL